MAEVEPIIFGTDGWRGVIAESFTFDNVRRVAAATASFFKENPSSNPILIGYDRRFFSPEFARCAAASFQAEGLKVLVSAGSLTTPALSVCVKARNAPWGIMITASHNPAVYNGFKVKDSYGRSAQPEVTRAIEQRLPPTAGSAEAAAFSTFNAMPEYLRFLKSRLDLKSILNFKGSVVFDYLHGTASGVPQALLKGSKFRMTGIHEAHDPLFGGLHPEPIEQNLSLLKQEIRLKRASIGLAFDGDGDRLGVVDDRGVYLTPHQVFPLLALHALENRKLPGAIVQAVSLGYLGERIAQEFHRPFYEVPVGFKYIAERMIAEPVAAGGEESGGYALGGGLPERDGILSGLFLLEMMAVTRKRASELIAGMEKRFGRSRFKRVDIHLKNNIPSKEEFVKKVISLLPDRVLGLTIKETRTFDGLKIILQNGWWVLLRPSGTEPLLRTYAETESNSKSKSLLAQARMWANSATEGELE